MFLEQIKFMKSFFIQSHALEIRPIAADELEDVFEVYRQCEDFLSLGPVPLASMEMVVNDIEISRNTGGIFCGIYTASGKMIGVIDYVPNHYDGDPAKAFLELLMIAGPYRSSGVGRAVVEVVEQEILNNSPVHAILAGVQVNNHQAVKFWLRNGYRIVSGPTLMPDQTTVYSLRKDI